jgi:hypothetical protein
VSYWRIIEANAAMRREQAFQRWRESGYRDGTAFEQFMAMFCAANRAASEARRVGA